VEFVLYGDYVFPGENAEVVFDLFHTAGLDQEPLGFGELVEGSRFEIAEGRRAVGAGQVVLRWLDT